jgi:hypothetical protein
MRGENHMKLSYIKNQIHQLIMGLNRHNTLDETMWTADEPSLRQYVVASQTQMSSDATRLQLAELVLERSESDDTISPNLFVMVLARMNLASTDPVENSNQPIFWHVLKGVLQSRHASMLVSPLAIAFLHSEVEEVDIENLQLPKEEWDMLKAYKKNYDLFLDDMSHRTTPVRTEPRNYVKKEKTQRHHF